MEDCDEITDAGLEELRKISGLTSINIMCCRKITDMEVKKLQRIPTRIFTTSALQIEMFF